MFEQTLPWTIGLALVFYCIEKILYLGNTIRGMGNGGGGLFYINSNTQFSPMFIITTNLFFMNLIAVSLELIWIRIGIL